MNTTRSFAAYNKDDSIRAISSSGGVFYAFAEDVILDGGIVFGASFDSDWQVHHEPCDNMKDLQRIMQSKYVQSSLGNTYNDVREVLISNKRALFCGTPCQVAGLHSFLTQTMQDKSWNELLLTVDFICHGVPSRMVWRRYLRDISEGKCVCGVNFRDKSNGWINFGLRIDFTDGSTYLRPKNKDVYIRGFLNNLYLRESCYECNFRGVERVSDFTIGDFWGVHNLLPDFFDDKGTSIIMAHSDKAIQFLRNFTDKLNLSEIQNETVIQTNSSIVKSVNRNSKRDCFFAHNDGRSIRSQIVKNLHQSLLTRIKRKIVKIFRFW